MVPERTELLTGLGQIPMILSRFVQSIPANRLDLRRGAKCWTIAEHVSHLAEVQPMLLGRLERFTNEEHPEFAPYIPGDDEDEPETPATMAMEDALAQFANYRAKQLALLKDVDNSAWKRPATHPEYDRYSFYILVRHLLMHDYWHMYRMEELWLMAEDAYLTTLP